METPFLRPIIILSLILIVSCSQSLKEKPEKGIDQFKSLTGVWRSVSGETEITERWKFLNDTTMQGEGFFISKGDTLSHENISIQKRANGIFYVPAVSNQNQGKEIYFRNTHSENNEWIFVNPEHDYPQKITYALKGNDSLIVSISSLSESQPNIQWFRMHKVQDALINNQ